MFKTIYAVVGVCLISTQNVFSLSQDVGCRRTFFKRTFITSLISGAFVSLDVSDDNSTSGGFPVNLRPPVAGAYERRDVGDAKTRSAVTAAMNEQAYQTNSRLEQSGFHLDTREEEQARLNEAFASFSYDSAQSKKKSGYDSKSNTKSKTDSKSK